ncbi:MAG: hypothetical protein Q8K59_01335 [Nitrosomonas sp.]|nr:hypothetical protein [Nitrosomonas sp.]MDP1949744.1 hypothetical protein [Nitrosomonas sp.]
MQPIVLINHHRNTALMVAVSGKKRLVIKLGKGKLTVSSLSAKEIETQGYAVSNYPPGQAAKSYLCHGAGVSKRAQRYLENIADGEFSDVLLFAQESVGLK